MNKFKRRTPEDFYVEADRFDSIAAKGGYPEPIGDAPGWCMKVARKLRRIGRKKEKALEHKKNQR